MKTLEQSTVANAIDAVMRQSAAEPAGPVAPPVREARPTRRRKNNEDEAAPSVLNIDGRLSATERRTDALERNLADLRRDEDALTEVLGWLQGGREQDILRLEKLEYAAEVKVPPPVDISDDLAKCNAALCQVIERLENVEGLVGEAHGGPDSKDFDVLRAQVNDLQQRLRIVHIPKQSFWSNVFDYFFAGV